MSLGLMLLLITRQGCYRGELAMHFWLSVTVMRYADCCSRGKITTVLPVDSFISFGQSCFPL
jgi:hypothetical protein